MRIWRSKGRNGDAFSSDGSCGLDRKSLFCSGVLQQMQGTLPLATTGVTHIFEPEDKSTGWTANTNPQLPVKSAHPKNTQELTPLCPLQAVQSFLQKGSDPSWAFLVLRRCRYQEDLQEVQAEFSSFDPFKYVLRLFECVRHTAELHGRCCLI